MTLAALLLLRLYRPPCSRHDREYAR
jgi:hypothetical protein